MGRIWMGLIVAGLVVGWLRWLWKYSESSVSLGIAWRLAQTGLMFFTFTVVAGGMTMGAFPGPRLANTLAVVSMATGVVWGIRPSEPGECTKPAKHLMPKRRSARRGSRTISEIGCLRVGKRRRGLYQG